MALKSQAIIDRVKAKVAAADPNPANRKALIVIDLTITDGGKTVKQITIDLKKLVVSDGSPAAAEVKLVIDDEALVQMDKGDLTKDDAKKSGKLIIEGGDDSLKALTLLLAKLKE